MTSKEPADSTSATTSSKVLIKFLRLFSFVRQLERDYSEARDARIKAETLAAEYLLQRDGLKSALDDERIENTKQLERIADILCRRFLGSSLSEIDQPEPSLESLATSVSKPKLTSFAAKERQARNQLAEDMREFLNGPTD
jgi:hypothetical protein